MESSSKTAISDTLLSENPLQLKKHSENSNNVTHETILFSKKELPLDNDAINELAHIFEEHAGNEDLFSEEKGDLNESPLSGPKGHKFNYKAKNMETLMNTESDIFSSPKSIDSGSTQKLTKRLYSHATELLEQNPYTHGDSETNLTALDELKKLAETSHDYEMPKFKSLNSEEDLDSKANSSLFTKIASFQTAQTELINRYLKENQPFQKKTDFVLLYLNGWPIELSKQNSFPLPILLTEPFRRSTGGIFVRWNGKGIVINPGSHFLKYFHMQGLHIHDIDYVLVTGSNSSCYAEVKELYDVNYELNKVSSSLHVIHYYLNHHAFEELSRSLKPNFKQERETLHSLEIFLDSPDVEKIELSEGILLHYFSTSNREFYFADTSNKDQRALKTNYELGIKLELKPLSSENDNNGVRLGYIGQCAWNPLLAHHLGHCDVLLTSFGNTASKDVNKMSYNSDSLGYYGTFTLLEEVAPKLLICGEFGGREGDIRLETCHKIRFDYYKQMQTSKRDLSTIIPADIGLCVCLKSLKIKCSITDEWIAPSKTHVTKTANTFGSLIYLSPNCCY